MTGSSPAVTVPPAGASHRRVGAVIGGVASGAVVLGVAEIVTGLLLRTNQSSGTPSPAIAVGEAFVDRTPLWLKNFAVDTFGTNDKKALFVGIAVVLLGLCCLIGLLLLRNLSAALVAMVVVLAIAAAAVLSRPNSGGMDLLPTIIGGGAGLGALTYWYRRFVRVDHDAAAESPSDATHLSRRSLVGFGALAVAGAGAMALTGRALSDTARRVAAARKRVVIPRVATPVTVPAGASLNVRGVTPFVVPQADFYRIDTALVVPQVDPDSWRLKVTGMVEREIEIDFDTLMSKPMQEAMVTLMCVSNEVGGNLNGNAIWTGWPVRELLAQAKPKPGADMVLSRSADGWTAGTPLEALTDNRNALLAIGMNREPLTPSHGFPVRLVVPGLYGYVSATKWVTELKLTTFAQDEGYWTPRGWSAKGPVKTSSRIDVPAADAKVSRGANGKVAVAGVAWAQHRGITGVQVRIDEGPWQDARLGTDATVDAWRQWVYEWPATSGKHTVEVRARDARGEWQIETPAPPDPDGSTGLHSISVTVS